MVEDMQAEHRQVKQLFGPDATITGRMGSGVAPGCIEIRMGDRRLSCGRTFQQAVEIATRKASGLSLATRASVAELPTVASGE